jgi:DNA-binding SARP family transcriptional activator
MAVPAAASSHGGRIQVGLLGGFRVVVGGRDIALPVHAQRVVAYLSINRRAGSHGRVPVAEQLWPASSTSRAQANLRTALWRIRQVDRGLVRARQDGIWVGPEVEVDLHDTMDMARRLVGDDLPAPGSNVEALRGELLPGWEEDWLLVDRERIRQLQVHALDAMSRQLCSQGRYAEAIDSALAEVALEPMREASHATLVAAYVADGNVAAALRQKAALTALLDKELSVVPSRTFMSEFERLVGG